MKLIFALLFMVFTFLYDIVEIKQSLYTISVIATMLNIYNSYKDFSYLESMVLTLIITFLKGFCIELFVFDRFIFTDWKTLTFAGQVVLQSILLGNPYVIRLISVQIKKAKIAEYLLSIIDKLACSIILSICYTKFISTSSIVFLICFTLFNGLVGTIVLFIGMLEHQGVMETFQNLKWQFFDSILLYIGAMELVLVYESYFKGMFGLEEQRAIHLIVINSFIVIYTILSISRSKQKK